MADTKITTRPATREDADIIAKAIAMAIGDEEALRRYCGDDYMAVLAEIARCEATQYSWQYAIVAEVEGRVAGAVVGYDGGQLYTLREGTFAVLRRCVGRTPNIVDETEAGEYYLDSVGVLPEYRGLGVGRALVEAFCRRTFMEGHTCVGLIVDYENHNAETLYTSLGFRRINTKPFFTHQMWHLQREMEQSVAYQYVDYDHLIAVIDKMYDEEGGALYWCDWSKDNAFGQTNDRENKYFIPKIEVSVPVVEPKFDFEKL